MDNQIIKKNFRSAASESSGLDMPLGHAQEAMLRIVSSQDFVTTSFVQKKIDEAFGGTIAHGGIYTTLKRLERDNYIQHTKSPPLPERGGKSQNVYSITIKGWSALQEQDRKVQIIRALSGNRPVPCKPAPKLMASRL